MDTQTNTQTNTQTKADRLMCDNNFCACFLASKILNLPSIPNQNMISRASGICVL